MHDAERLLLDHAPDGIYWTRRDGSFAYVNLTAATMLGFTRERLLQLRIFEIDADLDADSWSAYWEDASARESVTLERTHQRADGSRILVEIIVQHLQHDGQPVHFSFVRDIRERKRVEALQHSRMQYFQALFSDSPLPQFIVDPEDMRLIDVNRAAELFYGYSELRGMKISDINTLPPARIREEMNRARGSERRFFRFLHRLASGEVRPVHVYSSPIEHEGRQLLHSSIEDMSEIQAAQQQLEGYRDLVERLPIGIYRATLGAAGIFLSINPAMCEIFEAEDPSQLIGRTASDVYARPEERGEFSQQVEVDGEVRRKVVEARTLRGRPIWIALSSRITRLENGERIVEGAIEDVTELHRAEQKLREAFARMVNAIHAAPVPIMLHRADGTIEEVNRVWLELTGYRREQLATIEQWTELAYGERKDAVLDVIKRLALRHDRVNEGDFEIRCQDGSIRIWSFSSAPLEPAEARNRLIISTAVDVTDQRTAEARMRQAAAVIDSANEGITITDPQRNIERVNAAFSRITGYTESEVLGKNPRILSSGRQDHAFYQQMWETIAQRGHWQGEIWNRRKNGEIYPEWLSISSIRDGDGTLINYAGVFTDLTELKESRNRLDFLQYKDALTGLDNRAALIGAIDSAIQGLEKSGQQLTVLVCGLDRFQRINASLGYAVGDRVLKQIGRRLVRISGTELLVARAGSDQFALLLRSTGSQKAIRRALRTIRSSIARDIKLADAPPIPISMSTGIACHPADGESAETLLGNAETAMFRAKKSQTGEAIFFSADENQNAHRILLLETDLRRAIEDRELAVFYQPIVRLRDRRIVGAEALARWNSAKHGNVPPDEFIPLAEESGLIRPLTRVLLERAAAEAVKMRQCFGPAFRLAFNFSASQLDDSGFAEQLFTRLAAAGLPREGFEMELTESTMMSQDKRASEMLQKLRDGGIRLSIDDFGTGFSSLAYLHELQAHSLKVDRRFIAQLGHDPAGERITESIIAMAHALGMAVIAEGVETSEQRDRLDALGCEYAQGYLFSRPQPFDEFMELYHFGVG